MPVLRKVTGVPASLPPRLVDWKNDDPACKREAGELAPVINRNRCEGKDKCVWVCPYKVFEVRKLSYDDRCTLTLRSRFKA